MAKDRHGACLLPSYYLRLARSADGIARDDQFHAAILLFAGGCVIRRDGLTLAEACCSQGVRRNAPGDEVVTHGRRSAFGQRLIEVRRAHTVRMSLDFDVKSDGLHLSTDVEPVDAALRGAAQRPARHSPEVTVAS